MNESAKDHQAELIAKLQSIGIPLARGGGLVRCKNLPKLTLQLIVGSGLGPK